MKDTSDELSKRAAQVAARNRTIEGAAMALARKRTWPSPAAVAKESGLSFSVVEREVERLNRARRLWVKIVGHEHSHWRDPDEASQRIGATEADPVTRAERDERAERKRKKLANVGRKMRELKAALSESEEEVRRLLLGVRPEDISAIIDAGEFRTD